MKKTVLALMFSCGMVASAFAHNHAVEHKHTSEMLEVKVELLDPVKGNQ